MSDFLQFFVSHTPLHSLTITILLVNSFLHPSQLCALMFFRKLDSDMTKSTSAMLGTLRPLSPKLRSAYCLSLSNAFCESAGIPVVKILHSLQGPSSLSAISPQSYWPYPAVNQYTSIVVNSRCCWNWWPHLTQHVQGTLCGWTPSGCWHQTPAQQHWSGNRKYIQILMWIWINMHQCYNFLYFIITIC